MLKEPSPSLRKAALRRLLKIVDTQWHEVAQSLPELEALAEADGEDDDDIETRQTSAAVASHVYFHLEEPSQALRLALESGVGIFDTNGLSSNKAYVDCLVAAAIDAYVAKKKSANDGEDEKDEDMENASSLSMEKLTEVVQFMFKRCYEDGNFQYALGVALEAKETAKMQEILSECAARSDQYGLYRVLKHSLNAVNTLVASKKFRDQVVAVIGEQLQYLMESSTSVVIQKEAAVTLSHSFQILKQAAPVANIISKLLDGTEDESLLGLQLCFDLVETGDQNYVNQVEKNLPKKGGNGSEESGEEEKKEDEVWARYAKAVSVLTGGFASELALSFLHKYSESDVLIMQNLKRALEERGAGRNSLLHNSAVLSHSYLNAGTTNDAFLRDNLEWMKKASNWAKFSATASLGVVHAGHITEAMSLLEPYLPPTPNVDDPSASAVAATGGYAEGGSLYALGLIHGSDASSSSIKRKEANEFLRGHLRNSHANEAISHGAALGVGLTALGTNDLDTVNDLKALLYTDSAVAGEGAGIAIGMVLVGSGAGNLNNNLDPRYSEEIVDVITELKNYARETMHEKIIRGIVMGLALVNYGQEENADAAIDEMRSDRDPLMRYGAQYALALAYCGTGSNKAIRLLLHTAVSDVSDDVRMAAVIGLAFVLYKTPERVPQLVKLLLESFNPHVRYASCMAVGIAMAGTGDAESVALLEPMLTDMSDFVRQGALIGTAMIYMQQSDTCNGKKAKSFREKLSSTLSDKHQSTLTKMGATLATGIIDAGGRNCTFNLGSKNGFTKMTSAVGTALWLQHWYWYPMMHMFSLAISPTFTIALNKDFKYPKNFEIQCNSKPSAFAYPKRLEEKKEETKKRVETVTLSTTAKSKARLARKKAKEEGEDSTAMEEEDVEDSKEGKTSEEEDVEDSKEGKTSEEEDVEDSKEGKTSEEEDVEDSKEGKTSEAEMMDVDVDEKKVKKKKEPEPSSFALSNPCRITKAQVDVCTYDLSQRYHAVRQNHEKPCGVILVTDSTPGEDEDLGTVKAPSIESEDEAEAPEPFYWTAPGAASDNAEQAASTDATSTTE